jgi:cobalt-zinc-cadmium resistance protein CzcA
MRSSASGRARGTAEVTTDPMGVELSDVFITSRPRERWTAPRPRTSWCRHASQPLHAARHADGLHPAHRDADQRDDRRHPRRRRGQAVRRRLRCPARKAREIDRVLAGIPGASDLYTEQITGQPVLEVEVDRQALARYGMTAREVLESIEALAGQWWSRRSEKASAASRWRCASTTRTGGRGRGGPAPRLQRGQRRPDPSLPRSRRIGRSRAPRPSSASGASVGSWCRPTCAGATWARSWPRRSARSRGGSSCRRATTCASEASSSTSRRPRRASRWWCRGARPHLRAALRHLWPRARRRARVHRRPLRDDGGGVALWLRDIPFSVSAGVGFVALSGVAVLGDMVLVSTIRQLVDEGRALGRRGAGGGRAAPAAGADDGAGGQPRLPADGPQHRLGAEVQRPLATVVIGGVISSTLLTLVVLPVLYTVLRRRT